jgi:hypothetical protein
LLYHANACPLLGGAALGVDGGGSDAAPISSVVTVTNATFADHDCPSSELGGNAVYADGGSRVTVLDSILWNNAGKVVYAEDGGTVTIGYSLVDGPLTGEGITASGAIVTSDPLFADPANADYRVRSQAGRWDPGAGTWVIDEETSPAIDAGSPVSEFVREPDPNGGRVNLGHTGNTAEASKTYAP